MSAKTQPGAIPAEDDSAVQYVLRFEGGCRDCADEAGVCPRDGLPCRDRAKSIAFVLRALRYGVQNGYLPAHVVLGADRSTRPVQPEAPGAVIEFAKWVISEGWWKHGTLEGDEIQEAAIQDGLVTRRPFNPETDVCQHGATEEGDDWFEFAPTLSTPSSDRIRQETAEERIREEKQMYINKCR